RNESEGITSWHCATQMVLVNNISFQNGKTGILVGANDPGCINDNSVVNNNILIHNGWHDYCTYTDGSQCPIGNHSGSGGVAAVGKGTSMDAPPYDFENFPRPYGGGFDIGPYQWHP